MPESRPLTRRQEILLQEEYCACFTIPVLFWLLASLTIIMGFYGTKSMVLGPSYSHLVEANPLFVSGIQFQAKANHPEGLVLYSFSEKPILGFQSVWNESLSVSLRPEHHQEFSLWLNKGSRLRLTCFIKSSGFYSVIMTVSQGHNGLQKWLKHPSNRHATASWTGQVGDLEYKVQQDGDYFITIRNLNLQIVEIEFQLDVNATLYELESAYSKCSFAEESCEVQLPLWGKRYALLTSPASENGAKNWEVELVYNARWTSYYSVLIAILIFVSALLKVVKKFDLHIPEPSAEIGEEGLRDPLLSPKATQAALGPCADLLASEWDHGNAYDPQLCAVCLDASKAVFFIPCGHCATCLPCGKRVQHSDSGTCPICRVKIEKVKRVVQP